MRTASGETKEETCKNSAENRYINEMLIIFTKSGIINLIILSIGINVVQIETFDANSGTQYDTLLVVLTKESYANMQVL